MATLTSSTSDNLAVNTPNEVALPSARLTPDNAALGLDSAQGRTPTAGRVFIDNLAGAEPQLFLEQQVGVAFQADHWVWFIDQLLRPTPYPGLPVRIWQYYPNPKPNAGAKIHVVQPLYLQEEDKLFVIDATSGPQTVVVPPAVGVPLGRRNAYKKIDSTANLVSLIPSGIDVLENTTLISLAVQYDSVTLESDGVSKWWVAGIYKPG